MHRNRYLAKRTRRPPSIEMGSSSPKIIREREALASGSVQLDAVTTAAAAASSKQSPSAISLITPDNWCGYCPPRDHSGVARARGKKTGGKKQRPVDRSNVQLAIFSPTSIVYSLVSSSIDSCVINANYVSRGGDDSIYAPTCSRSLREDKCFRPDIWSREMFLHVIYQ